MEPKVEFERGPKIRGWAGSWHQHTRVVLDGVRLDGGIQDRGQGRRTTNVTTYVGGYGVRGADWRWLAANQPA